MGARIDCSSQLSIDHAVWRKEVRGPDRRLIASINCERQMAADPSATPLACSHRQELQPEMTATASANGCDDSQRMRNQEFNLEEIPKLHIGSGIESHPVLAQFSASSSHRDRGKPTAGKDADRQINR